jgi:hypothetical protein
VSTIKLIGSWIWTISFVLMLVLLSPFVLFYSWLKYKIDTRGDRRRVGFDKIT